MPRYHWNHDTQSLVVESSTFMYRSKWVCFSCRHAFVYKQKDQQTLRYCSSCGEAMIDMGYLFEPPKKRDKKVWKVVQALQEYGFRYHKVAQVVWIKHFIIQHKKATLNQVIHSIKNYKLRKNS